MWRNVVESGAMWRIVVQLYAPHCATWRQVAQCGSCISTTISHIEPHLATKYVWRHIGPHSATLSQEAPL